jgi:hypothetical protein
MMGCLLYIHYASRLAICNDGLSTIYIMLRGCLFATMGYLLYIYHTSWIIVRNNGLSIIYTSCFVADRQWK